MSIYLYIFIMTLVSVFVMLIAINACLKSHDKIFDAIEKVNQTKVSNANELSWKPSKEQMNALIYVVYHLMPDEYYREEMFSLLDQLQKL